ncbi:hypothetical protein Dsin_004677 [Dipteronia sinensis]|uniref:C2H2-type domain-containing protein n=1 Tax=Dipteronia sinensis TaxID=43782 RepID=A0AAE0EFR4_9ROSI|nr:hypothetical protein Dsin_004677 [Dipteronia sinensis]
MFQNYHNIRDTAKHFTRLSTLNPYVVSLYRYCHIESKVGIDLQKPPTTAHKCVGIFWDLDNKPPNSIPPFDAAIRLKNAVSLFGVVRYMIAYANSHAFSYVPQIVREQRKERKLLNQLENKGVIKPESYLCRVCGRRFYTNEKFVNHFKQIHEREQKKRLNQIESARGKRRADLVVKYTMKMEKYKRAARDVLTPKVGYGLADELKRAGFFVKTVPDKPEAADIALRDHMVDMMDKRRIDCLVLVSDDSDFVEVLREAKLRCLKTVVVGDINNGALKRVADANFSWRDILMGKAKKEAVSVAGKWKDHDILKRLEWRYNPEVEKNAYDLCDEREDADMNGISSADDADYVQREDDGAWWELDSSDSDVTS